MTDSHVRAAVELKGVTLGYGRAAVTDLDLVVPPGELTMVVGPNGGGQSTAHARVGAPDHAVETPTVRPVESAVRGDQTTTCRVSLRFDRSARYSGGVLAPLQALG
jgi:ABC-type transporter Mla maintaining outer membrane lipid asymmetry ATPase subunit MlaF